MRVVAVTGAAGYIGRSLLPLLADQANVIAIDIRPPTIQHDRIEWHKIDIVHQRKKLNRALILGNVDTVVHLAALKDAAASDLQRGVYWDNNVNGTAALLRASWGVKTFVFASSAAVYGNAAWPTRESHALDPTSMYGHTKAAGESMVESWAQDRTTRMATSLRLFNVYGNGDDAVAGAVIDASQTGSTFRINGDDWPSDDGTPVRDFVHVEDVAEALVLACHRRRGAQYEVLNIGTGQGTSIRELCARHNVRTEIGPRRPGDLGVSIADPHQARILLDWQPQQRS